MTEIAIILAVAAGVAFLIIAASNSLVAKVGIWKSYAIWIAFISRPDIVATTCIAIVVTMAVSAYQPMRLLKR